MNDSGDQQQRLGSSMNPKIASDSGYGSNKSTQRSSGSSKSHESSISSESSAYPPHPDALVTIVECQPHREPSPSQGAPTKRKKKKNDRKLSIGEKVEARVSSEATKDSTKKGTLSQSVDVAGTLTGNSSTELPSMTQMPIMSPEAGSKPSNTHDSKALQMAALTHALSCMKRFHKPMTESESNEENDTKASPGKKWQGYFSSDIQVDDETNEETFASVISLEDGIVVYITPSITNILGFPKDMLVGRSFIDFVHPKDRIAFASHITCGMSFPMSEQGQTSNNNLSDTASVKSEPFYCRLRQYRGLKTVGFGVVDKSVLYFPFKLTMSLKKVEQPQKIAIVEMGSTSNGSSSGPNNPNDDSSQANSCNEEDCPNKLQANGSVAANIAGEISSSGNGGGDGRMSGISFQKPNTANSNTQTSTVHLVIVASRINSAYQYSDEIPLNPGKFVTRHSASCHIGHMDSEAISYLGYLPQDLIGNSVLDYYHPDDMGLLKDIYQGVMQEQGKPFKSKPYRFRLYNGTFAILETDWSCFINPWTWKLEFVIGQHRVVKGPGNPNVFMEPSDGANLDIPDEILLESKNLQLDIKRLLTESVTRRLSDPLRQQSSRRRKDLAALMESLLEGMAKEENSDKSGSQCSGMISAMERDSVMLGEISPHHDDHSGSNQSSETPPSYNQLNYKENIERFFQSQPKTVRSDESAGCGKMETAKSANRSSDSDSKSSPNIDYSSGSNASMHRLSSESNENECGERDCISPLTEERLSRHNEVMEKVMIQRHRELRGKSSMTPGCHKECRHRHFYKGDTAHGVKRMGNASWDGDAHNAKQPHLDYVLDRGPEVAAALPPRICCPSHTSNLWPPFSITMTPGITTPTYRYSGVPEGSACLARNRAERGQCSSRFPESDSARASAPSAHMLLLSSQHNPRQFLPQQVQLFPTGVVYQQTNCQRQPTNHTCIYGQPSPIMLPAGFLGTMMHPGQERFKYKENMKQELGPLKRGVKTFGGIPIVSKSGFLDSQHGKEGSGSEESMLSGSKDFQDEAKDVYSQSNSEDAHGWSSQQDSKHDSWGQIATVHFANTIISSQLNPARNQQPPWLEQVEVTPELMLKYKLPDASDLSDILRKDLEALKIFGKQSTLVNDQLGMLYNELHLDGDKNVQLNLDEGLTSSSSGDENAKETSVGSSKMKVKKSVAAHQYSKLAFLYEENAPLPPDATIANPESKI